MLPVSIPFKIMATLSFYVSPEIALGLSSRKCLPYRNETHLDSAVRSLSSAKLVGLTPLSVTDTSVGFRLFWRVDHITTELCSACDHL